MFVFSSLPKTIRVGKFPCVSRMLALYSSMILSHKYKFIFSIKTAKTAGTSIEVFLSKRCGPQDVVTPIVPRVEGHQPRNYRRPD